MKKLVLILSLLCIAGCAEDKLQVINNTDRVTDLERRMTLNEQLDAVQASLISSSVAAIALLDGRAALLETSVADLVQQAIDLTARMDREGVVVYKCVSPPPSSSSSEERFFKINGKFYGAMNQVTTGTSTVASAATPMTVTVPKLCLSVLGTVKLPNGAGNCTGLGWSVMPGTGVTTTIPQNTSSNITVVTSVQISLEELLSGSNYATTDGTATCTFNGNGTNLVPVN